MTLWFNINILIKYKANMASERVNKIVNEIFADFNVIVDDSLSRYSIYDKTDELMKLSCLIFTFSSDFSSLYINGMLSCGDAASGRNGKSLMELMDRLAASIPNFKFIQLQDGSSLFFCDNRIDLASLKILTSENAESWYGSLGYKGPTDVTNKNHNRRIANMTVDEALSDRAIIDQTKYNEFKAQTKEFFPNLDTNKLTAKKYVNEIFNYISKLKVSRTDCNDDELKKSTFVSSAINALGKLLKHNVYLKKPNVSISSGMTGSVSSGTISGKPYASMIPGGIGTGFGGRRGTKRKRRASKKRGKSRKN